MGNTRQARRNARARMLRYYKNGKKNCHKRRMERRKWIGEGMCRLFEAVHDQMWREKREITM